MGWSGGTDYFDLYVDLVLQYVPQEKQEDLIYKWYKILVEGDWDTQDESAYWDLLRSILVKKDPDRWRDLADDLTDDVLNIISQKHPDFVCDSELKQEISSFVRENL